MLEMSLDESVLGFFFNAGFVVKTKKEEGK